MKKTILLPALTLLMGITVASCGGDDDQDYIVQYPVNSCFTVMKDNNTGNQTMSAGPTYMTYLNFTKMTSDVVLSGLTFGGNQYPAINLSGLKWADVSGWHKVSGSTPVAASAGYAGLPIFSSFSLDLYDRIYEEAYIPGFAASYVLDGHVEVFSTMTVQLALGASTATSPAGDAYTNDNSPILFEFNPTTKMVTMEWRNAQFASAMPALQLVFDEIPFELGTDGVATFEKAEFIPKMGQTPNSSFPITNLKGKFDFRKGMEVEFECNVRNQALYKVVSTYSFVK